MSPCKLRPYRWPAKLGAAALLVGLMFRVAAGKEGAAERDAAAARLFDGPVQSWEVSMPEESIAGLRDAPRDYIRATVRIGGDVFRDVGIHLKGSAGSKRSVDDRPALSLKFNRFVKGQRAFGCEKLHLNNAVQDASTLHENLASRVYRGLGIPATRATHAWLRLNGRDMGVYVVKEAYDEDYVRRSFPEDAGDLGTLYEGAFVGDIDRRLQRDVGQGPDVRSDLDRLRAAVKAPSARRWAALTNALDVERFVTLAAVQLLLDDRDGYVRNRNNYRIYIRRSDGRAVFLPHGMDQLLMNADGPIRDVWAGQVAQAVFGLPDQRIRLRERMRELVAGALSEARLTNEVAGLFARIAASAAAAGPVERELLASRRNDLLLRIHRRAVAVQRELQEWPDPLPGWKPGQSLVPKGWEWMVQTGAATSVAPGSPGAQPREFHFRVDRPDTRASYRTQVSLPAGSYRLEGRCRTRGLEPLEDQFGRGAAVRTTGSTAATESRMEGDRHWTVLHYDFEQVDDGPVELIVEVRANRGEAWFETESLRVVARPPEMP